MPAIAQPISVDVKSKNKKTDQKRGLAAITDPNERELFCCYVRKALGIDASIKDSRKSDLPFEFLSIGNKFISACNLGQLRNARAGKMLVVPQKKTLFGEEWQAVDGNQDKMLIQGIKFGVWNGRKGKDYNNVDAKVVRVSDDGKAIELSSPYPTTRIAFKVCTCATDEQIPRKQSNPKEFEIFFMRFALIQESAGVVLATSRPFVCMHQKRTKEGDIVLELLDMLRPLWQQTAHVQPDPTVAPQVLPVQPAMVQVSQPTQSQQLQVQQPLAPSNSATDALDLTISDVDMLLQQYILAQLPVAASTAAAPSSDDEADYHRFMEGIDGPMVGYFEQPTSPTYEQQHGDNSFELFPNSDSYQSEVPLGSQAPTLSFHDEFIRKE